MSRCGEAQQKVADAVQKQNLHNEIAVMQSKGIQQIMDQGKHKWPLTVSYDMAWQKRASGKQYNSSSGHGLLVALHTNKVIARIVYSRNCVACKNEWKKKKLTVEEATKDEPVGEVKKKITTHHCPRNYNASSKSMEGSGAVALVTEIYDGGIGCTDKLCTDDDSTTRANVRPSYKEVMKAKGLSSKASFWPKTKGGSYVVDRGKLPLCVRPISDYLADPSHRGKSVGRAFYKLEGKRGKELKFTSTDCEHLKRNYSFWHRQNRNETYDVFRARYVAVIDHHFGDHSSCQSKEEGGVV